jgi:hypothetical protein
LVASSGPLGCWIDSGGVFGWPWWPFLENLIHLSPTGAIALNTLVPVSNDKDIADPVPTNHDLTELKTPITKGCPHWVPVPLRNAVSEPTALSSLIDPALLQSKKYSQAIFALPKELHTEL